MIPRKAELSSHMFRKLLDWHRDFRARRLAIADFQWLRAEDALPFIARLLPADRLRLHELARQFIAEKQWTGADSLQLTVEMQLTISLQACLPILNLGLDWYRGWIGIVVYPGDFVIPRQIVDEDGVVHEFDDEVLGEAWDGGPVLLSWFAPDENPAGDAREINIVIHEFAHKLDMMHGLADGLPPLHEGMSLAAWKQTMQAAFDDLNQRLDEGKEIAIDPYAAEAPAEFFAVISETFFIAPQVLLNEYPAVYQQLAAFYRQDPAAVQP
jgi:Mlc titration factor MtfA (ptsG expression regulator)